MTLNEIVSDNLEILLPVQIDSVLSSGEKEAYDILQKISSVGMKADFNGFSFCPAIEFGNRRSFSVEDLTENDYKVLQLIDLKRIPLFLRVRIEDILWIKKKDYLMGKAAASDYSTIFMLICDKAGTFDCLMYLRRALCISAQINDKASMEAECKNAYDRIEKLHSNGHSILALNLINVLLERDFTDKQSLLKITDAVLNDSKDDLHIMEKAFSIKKLCLKKMNNHVEEAKTSGELAEYYYSYARSIIGNNMRGAIQSVGYLEKAIQIHRNIGNTSRADEIHRYLISVQAEIPKQMVPMGISIDIGKYIRIINANLEGLSFAECVIRLTQLISFPSMDKIRQRVLKNFYDAPLAHLFGKRIVNASGQTTLSLEPLNISNPEENQELFCEHMHQELLQEQNIMGDVWLQYFFAYIKDHCSFTENDIGFLVDGNPIIPSGRENIIRAALFMALSGKHYEAIHLLAPQIENVFRNIAKEVGGITVTLEDDGTSKEKVLKSIFDLPELVDSYDNDILFTFKGLLNERSGANIRNEIAHGLLGETNASRGSCLYFVAAVIKLLSMTSIKCYEILDSSPGLREFKELELLKNEVNKLAIEEHVETDEGIQE